MSQHLGAGQVVDGDHLIALSAEHLAESQTANAAETIDCNFDRHWNDLLKIDGVPYCSYFITFLPEIQAFASIIYWEIFFFCLSLT